MNKILNGKVIYLYDYDEKSIRGTSYQNKSHYNRKNVLATFLFMHYLLICVGEFEGAPLATLEVLISEGTWVQ